MSREQARYQALAACGAAIIAFIGVCHETVGAVVFPWAPALLGGSAGWHGAGIFCIAAGLVELAGTLRLIAIPVVPFAIVIIAVGGGVLVFAAVAHHQLHVFALAAMGCGAVTAYFFRKVVALDSRVSTSLRRGLR